jgi:iron complex outermembrane receptor protein
MNIHTVRLRRKRLAAAVALCCAGGVTTSVLAQQPSDTAVDEEILVTGSFIERPADRPQPVSIMDAEEIRAQQRITLAEVVRDMPQISTANTTNNWEFATNSINLRGLGNRSTLVLLNGQRMTIDANGGSQVDINNLAPSIMVERLELLLDGASALYGSDAVAGVANFITRDNFDGFELNVSSQWADTQTDVPEIVTSGIFGTQGNDSGLVMAFEIQRRDDKLQEEDRFGPDRLQHGLITALWNPGSFAGGSRVGGFHRDPLCSSPEIGGTADPDDITDYAGFISPPFCRGLLSLQRTNTPEQTNMLGMAVYTKNFDAGGLEEFRIEAGFARAEAQSSFGTGVPLLALPSVSGDIPILPSTNPGVYDAWYRAGGMGTPIGGTEGVDFTDGTFPYQDYSTIFSRQLGPLDGDDASLDSFSKQNTYRVMITAEGLYGDSNWDWRFNGTFSQNDQQNNPNDTITDRYMRAVQGYGGPSCKWNFVQGALTDPNVDAGVGSCQYWNPFASRLISDPDDDTPINPADPNSPLKRELYNSPELLDWMMFGGRNINEARFTSFEFITTGELWEMGGGATGLAIGAQYRKQELEVVVDHISKDGGFGFSPQILRDWNSNRDTDAFFAELVMFPTEGFEIDIAARYEDTLGISSTEPKISMLWTPTDRLYVRATAGSSFRLASESQLFGIGPGSVGRDTIGGEVTQAVGIATGNPTLLPEQSDNWTLGFTYDVTDNFTIGVDYWDYEFTNLVASTDAEDTLRADLLDGWVNAGPNNTNPVPNSESPHPLFPGRPNEYCEPPNDVPGDGINDDFVPGGTGRWDGVGPLPAGCVTGFDFEIFKSSWINQNIVVTNGVDLTLDWTRELSSGGIFGARFIGSFVQEYSGINNVTGELTDVVGTTGDGVAGISSNPEVRSNLILTYGRGAHRVRGTLRHTSGTINNAPNALEVLFDEGDYNQLDLTYDWDLNLSNPATFSVAVLNATDEEPPLTPNGLITYNAGLYDGRGRLYRLMWNQNF